MELFRRFFISKTDTALIIACAFCLLTCSYFLFYHDFNIERTESSKSVGYVKPLGPDIRLRSEKDISWNSIARDMNVYRNDRIFTGVNSKAKVKLRNNEDFVVEPNSLIIISDEKEKQLIEFSNGGLFAELKKGVSFFVKFKNQKTEITSDGKATVRLTASPQGKLNLTVLHGVASVRRNAQEKVEEVKTNEELEVSLPESKPKISNITLIYPVPGENKWGENKIVQFEWQTESASAQKIEISSEPDFSKDTISYDSYEKKKTVELPKQGTYFWRVVDARDSGIKSPVSSFSLHQLIPPKVASYGELQVELNSKGESDGPIQFIWNDQMASDKYEVELSTSQDFLKLERIVTATTTSVEINGLRPARYFWRVRSIAQERESLISNIGEFLLNTKVKPVEPVKPILAQQELPEEKAIVPPSLDPAPKESQISKAEPVIAKVEPPKDPPRPRIFPKPRRAQASVESPAKMHSRIEIEKPTIPNQYWFWLGGGAYFQYFKQTVPGTDEGNAVFQNTQGPTSMVRAGLLGNRYGLDAFYKDIPGKVKAANPVNGADYHWQTLGLDGLYHLGNRFNLRVGAQRHVLPFMQIDPNTSTINVNMNSMTMLAVGFDKCYLLSDKFKLEWLMHYLYPVSASGGSSASFQVSPQFAFDGSLGGVYTLSGRTRLGLFWSGQWFQYDFQYGGPSGQFSGDQAFFYSIMEMRFGFEF